MSRLIWDYAFEVLVTFNLLRLARDMMIVDPRIQACAHSARLSVGDLVHIRNPRTSFMYSIGAGASWLHKNWPPNYVLGPHMIVDGSMSKHILVPTVAPFSFLRTKL